MKLLSSIAVLLVVPTLVLLAKPRNFKLRDAFSIGKDSSTVTLSADTPDPSLPKVAGATPCGGSARFEDLRYAGCVSTWNETCIVPGDGKKKPVQFAFSTPPNFPIISQISVKIKASIWIFSETVVDMPVENSVVGGGQTYILKAEVEVDDDLAGTTVALETLIYDTYRPEEVLVCATANMRIVNP